MHALRRLRLQPLLSAAPSSKPKPEKLNDLEARSVVTPASAVQEATTTEVFQPPQTGTCPKCCTSINDTDEYRVQCFNCGTIFCWACGKPLEDDKADFIIHLQWWNVFGCQGLDKPKRVGYRSWDVIGLQLVFAIAAGVPSIVVAVCVGILTCGFLPWVVFWAIPRKHVFLIIVYFVGAQLMLFVMLAWAVVTLPIYPCVRAYRRCFPPEYPVKDYLW